MQKILLFNLCLIVTIVSQQQVPNYQIQNNQKLWQQQGQAVQGYESKSNTSYAIRLQPGEDLITRIIELFISNGLKAASISTTVGSVTHCGIRFAGNDYLTMVKGDTTYEIVSLVGTISEFGKPHIHISLADNKGHMVGGHLPSLVERRMYDQDYNCEIFTTAEIVIQSHNDLLFLREIDSKTGFDELFISYLNEDL